LKVAYLAQDLADPAVAKRVTVLRRGGADVDLYGFRRAGGAPEAVAGVVPHELGQAQDGKLARRAISLLGHSATAGTWARSLKHADVILARNLDNLFLAAAARRRLGLKTPLIYEMLDVHTLMFREGALSRAVRGLEGGLLSACDGVITSSPAFERQYLSRYHPNGPETLLVENKALPEGASQDAMCSRPSGPPWRIGWFGGIRCKPSLDCLSSLLKAHPGLFELHMRGRFVDPELGDVEKVIRESPGMYYHGPYKAPGDLSKIYSEVHFAWAVDLCSPGANADWLLPNRLYEGAQNGALPIAVRHSETGRWVGEHGLGLLVDLPLEEAVFGLLKGMTQQAYAASVNKLRTSDRSLFEWTDAACEQLVSRLGSLRRAPALAR
jgi:succinoglycan biosynthesis protein ExoL